MASLEMRNSQAGPSESLSALTSRGRVCGSTTRVTICQVEAPRVCAFTSCSRGKEATDMEMSRTMKGVTPMTISVTLATSPRPKTMKRIGSTASGGTTESTETTGAKAERNSGSRPIATPAQSPTPVATERPMIRRSRLASVSSHRM